MLKATAIALFGFRLLLVIFVAENNEQLIATLNKILFLWIQFWKQTFIEPNCERRNSGKRWLKYSMISVMSSFIFLLFWRIFGNKYVWITVLARIVKIQRWIAHSISLLSEQKQGSLLNMFSPTVFLFISPKNGRFTAFLWALHSAHQWLL